MVAESPPNRVQTQRFATAGQRPASATRQPGELYINFADKQLGVIDPTNAAQDLIGVRYFSATSSYGAGDHVLYSGLLYRATAPVSPGAFNPNQWLQVGGAVVLADTPPSSPNPGTLWWDSVSGNLYVYYYDGTSYQWVVAVNIPGALVVSSAPPSSATPGTLWWDSVGGQLYVYYNDGNSSQWVAANNLSGQFLPSSGGTLQGDLTINSPDSNNLFLTSSASNEWVGMELKAPAGQGNYIGASVGGGYRWEIDLGYGNAETGGNSGSDFQIARFNDAGNQIDNPIVITRSTGVVSFSQPIQAPGIKGVTNGSNAAAGNVGEMLTQGMSGGSVSAGSTVVNGTQLTITAGDWDVWGNFYGVAQAGPAIYFTGGLSNTSTAIAGYFGGTIASPPTGVGCYGSITPFRLNVTANTTVYLNFLANWTSPCTGIGTISGNIFARRRR